MYVDDHLTVQLYSSRLNNVKVKDQFLNALCRPMCTGLSYNTRTQHYLAALWKITARLQ